MGCWWGWRLSWWKIDRNESLGFFLWRAGVGSMGGRSLAIYVIVYHLNHASGVPKDVAQHGRSFVLARNSGAD